MLDLREFLPNRDEGTAGTLVGNTCLQGLDGASSPIC